MRNGPDEDELDDGPMATTASTAGRKRAAAKPVKKANIKIKFVTKSAIGAKKVAKKTAKKASSAKKGALAVRTVERASSKKKPSTVQSGKRTRKMG
jgi:hypothetical protein